MKKKIFLGILLATLTVSLFGCGKTIAKYVEDNLAEKTEVYYYGECEEFYASLSSGQREENYVVDGKCGKTVDFSLLSVKLSEQIVDEIIVIDVKINDEMSQRELILNPLNSCFMCDLEMKLSGNEKISIICNQKELELNNLSKDFQIDDEKAIEIACKELEKQIKSCQKGWNLNAECYLRVLDKKANNFDKMFWCFSVVNIKNETFSIVISTEDGSILAKSN